MAGVAGRVQEFTGSTSRRLDGLNLGGLVRVGRRPAAGHLGRRLANAGPITPASGYRRAGGVTPNQGIRGNRGSASLRKAFGPSPPGGPGGGPRPIRRPRWGIGVPPGPPPVRGGAKAMSRQEITLLPLFPRPSGNLRDLSGRQAAHGGDRDHWQSRRGSWTRIGARLAALVMQATIGRGPEAVHEDHRPEAPLRRAPDAHYATGSAMRTGGCLVQRGGVLDCSRQPPAWHGVGGDGL